MVDYYNVIIDKSLIDMNFVRHLLSKLEEYKRIGGSENSTADRALDYVKKVLKEPF